MAPAKRTVQKHNPADKRSQKIEEERASLKKEFSEIQEFMAAERKVSLQRWSIQKQLLSETLKYVEYVRRNAIKMLAKRNKQEDWNNYLKCDGLPQSYQPKEILNYLSKWRFEIEDDMRPTLDWSVDCDETSLMNQSYMIVNKTRAVLKSQQKDYAENIVRRVREVELIFKGLRKALHVDSRNFTKVDKSLLRDFRNELSRNLMKCIDIYTYRIIKNMERDMNQIDPALLQHSFSNEQFSIHLWSLRDVPQPKRTISDRFKIPLGSIGGEISFSYVPKMKDIAFRTYWTAYDHYSSHCPSYTVVVQPPPTVDLLTAMIQEWNQKDAIEQTKIAQLDMKKMELEKSINEWAEANDELDKKISSKPLKTLAKNKLKDTKDEKSQIKKKVRIKQPENLSLGSLKEYDTKADYETREDLQYFNLLESMIPSHEVVLDGDVNLRSHQILGGIFHVNYFPKPSIRRVFTRGQMVLTQNTPLSNVQCQTLALDNDETRANAEPGDDPTADALGRISIVSNKIKSSSPQSAKFDPYSEVQRRPTLRETLSRNEFPEHNLKESGASGITSAKNAENLILIDFKIKLPPNVMWLAEPSVCYWESWENSEEFQNLTKDEQHFHLHREEYAENLQKRLFTTASKHKHSTKIIKDFKMLKIPKTLDFYELCRDFVIPSLPYNYRTLVDIVLDQKAENKRNRQAKVLAGIISPTRVTKTETPDTVKANPIAPRPLFIPNESYVNVAIMEDENSENEACELILKMYQTNSNLCNHRGKEFNPPNILFSEFVKNIKNEVLQESAYTDQFQTLENAQNIKQDVLVDPISLVTVRRSKHRRCKRSKASKHTLGLGRSSILFTTKQDSSGGKAAELESKESRKSTTYKETIHPLGRWCTRKITSQNFDKENQTVSFQSPCFGAYALTINRYIYMPFKSWSLSPSRRGEYHQINFTIATSVISLEINITAEGFSLHIPKTSPIPIEPAHGPLSLYDFKLLLRKTGLDIFPECDAACYIENISEKHLSLEHHTYYSMACFCLSHSFQHSPWNRLSHRRRIVMFVNEEDKLPRKYFEVLIAPNECYKTKIREECNSDLEKIRILYDPDPSEQTYQPDFFFLLKSGITKIGLKDAGEPILNLTFNVAQLLASIRPLSFS